MTIEKHKHSHEWRHTPIKNGNFPAFAMWLPGTSYEAKKTSLSTIPPVIHGQDRRTAVSPFRSLPELHPHEVSVWEEFFLGRKYLEKQHNVSRVSEHLKWWVVFLEHTRTFCKHIFSTNRVTLQSFAMRHCSQCFQLTSFGSCCGEWQGTWLSFLRSKLQFIVDRFHPSIANYMSYTPEF